MGGKPGEGDALSGPKTSQTTGQREGDDVLPRVEGFCEGAQGDTGVGVETGHFEEGEHIFHCIPRLHVEDVTRKEVEGKRFILKLSKKKMRK